MFALKYDEQKFWMLKEINLYYYHLFLLYLRIALHYVLGARKRHGFYIEHTIAFWEWYLFKKNKISSHYVET